MDLASLNPAKATDTAKRFELINPLESRTIIVPHNQEEGTYKTLPERHLKFNENEYSCAYMVGPGVPDDKGVLLAFTVVGMASETAKNIDAKIEREKPVADKPKEDMTTDEQEAWSKKTGEYYSQAIADKCAAMVTKIEGKWKHGNKVVKDGDKEALAELIKAQPWVANQIIGQSKDLKNYRPKM